MHTFTKKNDKVLCLDFLGSWFLFKKRTVSEGITRDAILYDYNTGEQYTGDGHYGEVKVFQLCRVNWKNPIKSWFWNRYTIQYYMSHENYLKIKE